MKTICFTLLFTLFLAMSAFVPVLAAFEALDTNGDGKITKDEGPSQYNWPNGLFELKDLNGDGAVTPDEFRDWTNADRTKKLADELSDATFTALDWDKDGRIYKTDEWVGSVETFQRKDKDRDGYISRAEKDLLL